MTLTILPRSAWGARPASGPLSRRPPSSIHELFIHWPGDQTSWRDVKTIKGEITTLKQFQNYHMDTHGWSDIGYNHVMGNGGFTETGIPRIWTARGAQFTPAAQLAHNTGTLAICILIGPNDPLTDHMVSRLRSYIRWAINYTGNDLHIRPHGAVTQTDCPGIRLKNIIYHGKLTQGIAKAHS